VLFPAPAGPSIVTTTVGLATGTAISADKV
jgi:hypothetical protein